MPRRPLLFILFAVICLAGSVLSAWSSLPHARKRAVYGSDFYVSPSVYDYAPAARRIVGDATTPYAKAQRIYLWLCDSVIYDRAGTVRTADECWRTRRAVCQGYCELFYRLGQCVDLRMRLVYGKCRLPSVSPSGEKEAPLILPAKLKNGHADDCPPPTGDAGVEPDSLLQPRTSVLQPHVWLSVSTERGEILLDPTWGAGYYRGDQFVRQAQPLRWFDVDPSWFIYTHLPDHPRRQHLQHPVSDEEFLHLPFAVPSDTLSLSSHHQ